MYVCNLREKNNPEYFSYISWSDQYQLRDIYYSRHTHFFLTSCPYICPKFLKTHQHRFDPFKSLYVAFTFIDSLAY